MKTCEAELDCCIKINLVFFSFLPGILVPSSDHFRFGLIFKKTKNQTETGSNRPVSVRFGLVWFFEKKTSLKRFDSVFLV
jgi:hypothetical protein